MVPDRDKRVSRVSSFRQRSAQRRDASNSACGATRANRPGMRIVASCAIISLSHLAVADGHPEFAVRGGVHSTDMVFDDDAPAGKGPIIDVEADWRFKDWLSIGAWGSWAYLRDTIYDPFSSAKMYDMRDHMFELGARLNFHVAGAFAGFGIGTLRYRETTDGQYATWYGGTTAEVHVGYTFPKVDRFAFEVLASVSSAELDYDNKLDMVRVVAGVRL
jgi:hypothetical protein